jgi:hypothetical protein
LFYKSRRHCVSKLYFRLGGKKKKKKKKKKMEEEEE